MNNKALGTAFEKEMCEKLNKLGFWVHFITPNATGAQPFDIIAVKNNTPIALDCKTSAKGVFPITRLEENQKFAFERWLQRGNLYALIAVKFSDNIYLIDYQKLKLGGKLSLTECKTYEQWIKERGLYD